MAYLCISLNNSSVNTIHILDGELVDIDKYSIKYNNAREILKEFPEKIQELNNRFNLDNNLSDLKLRIFLPNDKEQFVMYKKHFISFKYLIQQVDFIKYTIENDNSLFNKEFKEALENDASNLNLIMKNYIEKLNENELYTLVRKICEQYDNYLEDYSDNNNLSFDEIASKFSNSKNVINNKKKESKNTQLSPFAVFEHPKFFKVYGNSIDKNKNILILGADSLDDNVYKELYVTCKKCFSNNILCPLNADIIKPIDNELADLMDNTLIAISYIKDTDKELLKKINYLSSKNITVLLLCNNTKLLKAYTEFYKNNLDNIIIKEYKYNDFDTLKMIADILAGFYINNYKKNKEG